jgi:hypothetical protein
MVVNGGRLSLIPQWLSIPVGRGEFFEWLDASEAYFYTWGTDMQGLPRYRVVSTAVASKPGQAKRPWRII